MEEFVCYTDISRAAPGQAHLLWAAQAPATGGLGPGVRAWRHGTAVAVASPGLSRRDRLAVAGGEADAALLARHALEEAGPSYRLFGEAALVESLTGRVPGLEPVHTYFWMDTAAPPRGGTADVRWLEAHEEKEAAVLFDRFFPDSSAQPGFEGVHRWAGTSGEAPGDAGPPPLAVAADAWSAPGCGFMAGVVTHPAARGRGLATSVCAFVLDGLIRRHGRAALMVRGHNAPAVTTYERLGMAKRLFGSAHLVSR
ncbi:GNAT family N-acetyltransferase [Streptomyces sp. NPDC020983]|uniref:GNAT family N-acetyltransferase n=1 Tax=Streptomyces sp. NPDC020983 TaxID=3365106 RepID=UPI00378A6115